MPASLFALAITLLPGIANADILKGAYVTLDCFSTQLSTHEFKIISDKNGATLSVDGQVVHEQQSQLFAGTEGGDPYLQIVGGGYNLTVFGGYFDRAFKSGVLIRGGLTKVSIAKPGLDRAVEGYCAGDLHFVDKL